MEEPEWRLFYSGGGTGVSLALLSVILFSSSSSDTRSEDVPSTCSWRLPERLEEKLMGPPRLQEPRERGGEHRKDPEGMSCTCGCSGT